MEFKVNLNIWSQLDSRTLKCRVTCKGHSLGIKACTNNLNFTVGGTLELDLATLSGINAGLSANDYLMKVYRWCPITELCPVCSDAMVNVTYWMPINRFIMTLPGTSTKPGPSVNVICGSVNDMGETVVFGYDNVNKGGPVSAVDATHVLVNLPLIVPAPIDSSGFDPYNHIQYM